MKARKLSAGDIVEARCTRCRQILNHTIVAMVGERIVRVECNTCQGVHNYHDGRVAEVKRASTPTARGEAAPRKARVEPGSADRREWESLYPSMQRERAVPYGMNVKFRVKDLVEHPVFGLGVVRTVAGNKMEVLFEVGKKLLRCG